MNLNAEPVFPVWGNLKVVNDGLLYILPIFFKVFWSYLTLQLEVSRSFILVNTNCFLCYTPALLNFKSILILYSFTVIISLLWYHVVEIIQTDLTYRQKNFILGFKSSITKLLLISWVFSHR